MVICGHGCLGYVIGTTVKPAESDLAYATWDAQNFMVMAWIVNSIEDDIKEPHLYYSTVNELWDALNIAFANLENFAQLFELRNKARNLRQGGSQCHAILQYTTKAMARNRYVCSD